MSVREFLSSVRNDFNSIHLDNYLSGEYIYWKGINVVELYLKRELDSRKLYKNTSVFQTVDCFKLENYCKPDCTCYDENLQNQISIEKLPISFQTGFGESFKVYSLTRDVEFRNISPTKYLAVKDKKYNTEKYFWIENNNLVLPDSRVEAVQIVGIFKTPEKVLSLNGESCIKILDCQFPCPDYLLSSVIEKTKEEVSLRAKINPDEDSNLNLNDKQ